jgi:multidrug efflux system membrane fusion protein
MNERYLPDRNPVAPPSDVRLDPAEPLDASNPPASAPDVRRRNRRRGWIVAAAAVTIAAAAAAWLWESRGAVEPSTAKGRGDPAARVMPVVAQPARQGTIDVYVSALGTVTPRNMVVVRSRVDGQLVSVAFSEGQVVRAGQLLAQIDPRPFEVQLTQANGQMARDQAQLNNARIDLDRYRTLLAQDSIAKQQVDTQAALVRQLEGTVEADKGAIDNAKLQLTYSRIVAPISGRVGLRQVDPGNIVHASDANGLVTITQVQPITVVFPVPEDNVRRVMKRMQTVANVAVDAYDRDGKVKLATGKLITIDNQIDAATGTIKLKAEFANDDSALFPNQFVNVRMAVETHESATLVPSPAIQRGAPGTFVYRVNDDSTVKATPVSIGAVDGETTELRGDIAPGTLVVVDGADKLREGSRVELIDRNAAQAPAAAARAGPREGKGSGERRKGNQGG